MDCVVLYHAIQSGGRVVCRLCRQMDLAGAAGSYLYNLKPLTLPL